MGKLLKYNKYESWQARGQTDSHGPDMADFACSQAVNALNVMFHEQQVAQFMKNQFEKKFKSKWHCIVGRNFGAYVTHEVGCYIYFYIGQKGFLIWATPT